METIVTITPKVKNDGTIIIELTHDQFDEINRALVAYNKRRDVHRNTIAKKRGTKDSKPCKPKLVLSYPVADTPTIIPQKTTYNVFTGAPIQPMRLIVNPSIPSTGSGGEPWLPQASSNFTAIPQIIVPRVPVVPIIPTINSN
jgi:hypothetical protein